MTLSRNMPSQVSIVWSRTGTTEVGVAGMGEYHLQTAEPATAWSIAACISVSFPASAT